MITKTIKAKDHVKGLELLDQLRGQSIEINIESIAKQQCIQEFSDELVILESENEIILDNLQE